MANRDMKRKISDIKQMIKAVMYVLRIANAVTICSRRNLIPFVYSIVIFYIAKLHVKLLHENFFFISVSIQHNQHLSSFI